MPADRFGSPRAEAVKPGSEEYSHSDFVGVGVDSDKMMIGCNRTDVPFGSTTQQKDGRE